MHIFIQRATACTGTGIVYKYHYIGWFGGSLNHAQYTFLVSFERLEVSAPFLFYSFLKISSFSYRIFENTTFIGEFLLGHDTVNELLCYVTYVAQLVKSIVTFFLKNHR
jgi:hypothetical protein